MFSLDTKLHKGRVQQKIKHTLNWLMQMNMNKPTYEMLKGI